MLGKRVTATVSWNLDQVPGWNYEPDDVVNLIQRKLDEAIPHYEPIVVLRTVAVSPYQFAELRNRIASYYEVTGDSYDEAQTKAVTQLESLGIYKEV